MNMKNVRLITVLSIILLFCFSLIYPLVSIAQTTTTSIAANSTTNIESAIAEKNRQIEELERQISAYQNQVQEISGQAKTLNQEVSQLRGSEKVLETSLKTTNTKIEKTNYVIEKNIDQIKNLSLGIAENRNVIGATLRSIAQNDERTPIEMFLINKSLSYFLQDYQDLQQFQTKLRGTVITMRDKSINLTSSQKDLAQKKDELKILSAELADKESIISNQRKEKNSLLQQTKNKESTYKKIVDDLQKARDQIDAEVRDYESKLKFVLNTKNLPQTGSETFDWPLDNPVITQQFGKTVDAKRLYTSGSHSGTDFRAAVGTPVYAVGSGTIEGTGDTDKTCPKASFGKWIFIRHTNGLSTAYGHLSLIKVSAGQVVKKGDLIGYSGNTGRSTGPHLHLTVYASNGADGEEGARITQRPSSACTGKTYTMPLAPTNAYLDPLVYLPKTGFSKKN